MSDNKFNQYSFLNEIAEPNGIVILGGENDVNIPVGELKQAFSIKDKMYNRSIDKLSVNNASEFYSAYVSKLIPDAVLLHIGEADLNTFTEDPPEFEKKYRELINTIKTDNKKCSIAVVSLKNADNSDTVSVLNRDLKYIAESEQCEYYDISVKSIRNPGQTKDVISFVYSSGFVRPLKNKRPMYDIVRILFCYNS